MREGSPEQGPEWAGYRMREAQKMRGPGKPGAVECVSVLSAPPPAPTRIDIVVTRAILPITV